MASEINDHLQRGRSVRRNVIFTFNVNPEGMDIHDVYQTSNVFLLAHSNACSLLDMFRNKIEKNCFYAMEFMVQERIGCFLLQRQDLIAKSIFFQTGINGYRTNYFERNRLGNFILAGVYLAWFNLLDYEQIDFIRNYEFYPVCTLN